MATTWWVTEVLEGGGAIMLVAWVFWVLLSITLHELAHGWAALWQGDDTPILYDRMTLNPVVHMGWWSLAFFALVGIAWGLMPITPSKFRWGRRGRAVVAGAGPAMNLALALASLIAGGLWFHYAPGDAPYFDNVHTFLYIGGMLNIVLALFNLLPVPPLDGSDILAGLSMRAYEFFGQPQAQTIGMVIVLVLLISGGFGFIFGVASEFSWAFIATMAEVLP